MEENRRGGVGKGQGEDDGMMKNEIKRREERRIREEEDEE